MISCGIMVLEIGRNKLPDKSEYIGVMNMEKYRYVIQSGILFLFCILQVYSNFGIYKDYSKNNNDPNITKKRKQILIAFSILSVILAIWFISEIIHVI